MNKGLFRPQPASRSDSVHGHIASADHGNPFSESHGLSEVELTEVVQTPVNAVEIFTRNAQSDTFLGTNGEEEGLESVFT